LSCDNTPASPYFLADRVLDAQGDGAADIDADAPRHCRLSLHLRA